MATMLDKRRRDREAVQAAKVRRLEDENAALRERELIRESTTEGEDEPAEIPVRSHLQWDLRMEKTRTSSSSRGMESFDLFQCTVFTQDTEFQ